MQAVEHYRYTTLMRLDLVASITYVSYSLGHGFQARIADFMTKMPLPFVTSPSPKTIP
jgi:hypothetical protein